MPFVADADEEKPTGKEVETHRGCLVGEVARFEVFPEQDRHKFFGVRALVSEVGELDGQRLATVACNHFELGQVSTGGWRILSCRVDGLVVLPHCCVG